MRKECLTPQRIDRICNSSDSLFYNNVCYENDGDIANAFADYFSSVFKPSTDFDGHDECKSNCVGDLVKIESVTYDDVVLAIRELKSALTVGVDNIPSLIIKGCAKFFIYPLLVLFNLSLRTKVFPDVWKQTRIIPAFKKVILLCANNATGPSDPLLHLLPHPPSSKREPPPISSTERVPLPHIYTGRISVFMARQSKWHFGFQERLKIQNFQPHHANSHRDFALTTVLGVKRSNLIGVEPS
ncbi:hypothetical protein AVEN_3366-1 [Araneus ventricosus]|uniref:Uncharacterized protein n=1 Tax=Araneus ventricosus TaxID=182803 RepID=A0A4Y2URM9_ARAVE|nr:hypothetical protein AVEN_3366-1 [Araneus ventricosus]